jgi:polyferredoxin
VTWPPGWSGSRKSRREADIRTVSRLLFAAYFLEAGFILVVAPWSAFWEHNRFAEARPAIEAFVMSPYARGGVTGVGVLTALAGFVELGSVILARGRRPDPEQTR